jgi:hypothetical protein
MIVDSGQNTVNNSPVRTLDRVNAELAKLMSDPKKSRVEEYRRDGICEVTLGKPNETFRIESKSILALKLDDFFPNYGGPSSWSSSTCILTIIRRDTSVRRNPSSRRLP